MTKVNIYYGGRGLIEDPTVPVMNTITQVLNELNVVVHRYNLYEEKKGITALPKTLKDADAIIIAASVEWFGIGGLLQQFLDACWLYGDKETIQSMHMMPVVLSTTYGEKDAYTYLTKAWDILGGLTCDGVYAFVRDAEQFETTAAYQAVIEKKVEDFFRCFTGKLGTLPSSDNVVRNSVSRPASIDLTPQESEQLSEYVSNDTYVQKQKEDIQELSALFRTMLGDDAPDEVPFDDDPYIQAFKEHFQGKSDTSLCFSLEITDKQRTIYLFAEGEKLHCAYDAKDMPKPDVSLKLHNLMLQKLIQGSLRLADAFRQGSITARGDFRCLDTFDQLFIF